MAAFSHFDNCESRAQSLRAPVVSASRVIARRSIDLKEIAWRVRAAAIEALLFAWAPLAIAFSFSVLVGLLT